MLNSLELEKIEKIIGYNFLNRQFLITALTHSSYSNENGGEDNERLEFLGDGILNFWVAERLYNRFTDDEGDLSVMRATAVSRSPLSHSVEKMGVLDFYQMGAGAKKEENISEKFKSNLFEALLAAIYLDSGSLSRAGEFIDSFLLKDFTFERQCADYKSKLQEYLQSCKTGWHYETKEDGEGCFISFLTVNKHIFEGKGRKKREAEQQAAKEACELFRC